MQIHLGKVQGTCGLYMLAPFNLRIDDLLCGI